MVNVQSFKSKLISEFSMGFLPIFPAKMGMIHSTPYGFPKPPFQVNQLSFSIMATGHGSMSGKPKDGLKEWNPMVDLLSYSKPVDNVECCANIFSCLHNGSAVDQ